jgi:hypothetical protein
VAPIVASTFQEANIPLIAVDEPERISFTEKWAGHFELVPDTGDDTLKPALFRKYGGHSK